MLQKYLVPTVSVIGLTIVFCILFIGGDYFPHKYEYEIQDSKIFIESGLFDNKENFYVKDELRIALFKNTMTVINLFLFFISLLLSLLIVSLIKFAFEQDRKEKKYLLVSTLVSISVLIFLTVQYYNKISLIEDLL